MQWNDLNYTLQLEAIDKIEQLSYQCDEEMQLALKLAISELQLWSNSFYEDEVYVAQAVDYIEEK